MQTVRIPWACWYGNGEHPLWFPDEWEVVVAEMEGAPSIDEKAVEMALDNPIDSPPLQELARGRKNVGIIIDDISRPTPGALLLPPIIRRLEEGGIKREDMSIYLSLGAHRPMTRADMIKKLGEEVVSTIQVLNHNPFADLVSFGTSQMGHPITINRGFAEKDLKISVGCIIPHPAAGFGGGAKNIIPGIGGMETLEANHKPAFYEKDGQRFAHRWVGNPDNPLRQDMEDIARKIGLEFIVNAVFNARLEVAGLFAGDLVAAHRAGSELAQEVYRTRLVPQADIVVFNAYPKDTEYVQITNAFNVADEYGMALLKGQDSTIIVTSASTEGAGFHTLAGPGMALFTPHDNSLPPQSLAGITTWIYSPNLSLAQIRPFFTGPPRPLYAEWQGLLDDLIKRHGSKALVAIYPMACLQMGVLPES